MSFGADVSQYDIHAIVGQGCGGAAIISAAKHKPSGQLVAIRRTNLEYKGITLKEIQVSLTSVMCRGSRNLRYSQ